MSFFAIFFFPQTSTIFLFSPLTMGSHHKPYRHHGCYLAVKIVSNTLKKAQGRKFEKECIQSIDLITIIPFGIIIWIFVYVSV